MSASRHSSDLPLPVRTSSRCCKAESELVALDSVFSLLIILTLRWSEYWNLTGYPHKTTRSLDKLLTFTVMVSMLGRIKTKLNLPYYPWLPLSHYNSVPQLDVLLFPSYVSQTALNKTRVNSVNSSSIERFQCLQASASMLTRDTSCDVGCAMAKRPQAYYAAHADI